MGGRETFAIASANLPTHVHAQSAHQHDFADTDAIGDHTHPIEGVTAYTGATTYGKLTLVEYGVAELDTTTKSAGSHSHSGTTDATTPDPTGVPNDNTSDSTTPGVSGSTGSTSKFTTPIMCVNFIIKF